MSVVTVWQDNRPMLPVGDWTVDDLEGLPDDGRRYELFDGVLVVSAAPYLIHQRAARALFRILDQACPPEDEVFFAPVDFQPTRIRSLQPDVLITHRADARSGRDPGRNLTRPLVLAVEVLSESTASNDQIFKRALYADSGVRYYWIFDPREPSLVAYRLEDKHYVEVCQVVGDDEATVALPYPMRICPAEIVEG